MKNSSISSSDRQSMQAAPVDGSEKESDWMTSLVAAMACALIVLIGYEWTLRTTGAQPNFRDNQARWSLVRDAVAKDRTQDSIALLGTSRIRAAISLAELESRYPNQTIYPLGYIGRGPCAVLQDLADNTEFQGTILVSMHANWVDCRSDPFQMHSVVARYHQEWNWARKIDGQIANAVTDKLVLTDPRHSIRKMILNTMEFGNPLTPNEYEITRENRQLEFNFSQISDADLERMRSHSRYAFLGRIGDGDGKRADNWSSGLGLLNEAIETIVARGGQVVIVRLPTSGPLRLEEEQHFPRQVFWDDLAATLPASTILHFEDDAVLSSFKTPDGNHVDYRDAPRFTGVLFDELERRGTDFSRR